ncbi:MAG: hypothetical protein RSD80_03250, partial [Raoultibacter sp.]
PRRSGVFAFASQDLKNQPTSRKASWILRQKSTLGSVALSGFVYDLEQILKVSIDASTTESLTHEFLNKIRNDEVLLYERPSKSD